MEWSREVTTYLIELYREQRALWDPTFVDFKNRDKKHDAWNILAKEIKTDANEVEKKMRMLIGQFQRELKRGKSVDGADNGYKTKWIFFKTLLFLKDKNEPRKFSVGGGSSNQIPKIHDTRRIKTAKKLQWSHSQSGVQDVTEKYPEKSVHTTSGRIGKTMAHAATHKGIKRRAVFSELDEAYAVMKQLPSDSRKRDDFDVYGEYVASTLRNLKSKSVIAHAKYEINNSLYRAEMAEIPQHTPVVTTTTSAASPLIPIIQIDCDSQSYRDTESYNIPGPSNSSSASSRVTPTQMSTESYIKTEDITIDE